MKNLYVVFFFLLSLNVNSQPLEIETFTNNIHTLSPTNNKLYLFSSEYNGTGYDQYLITTAGIPHQTDTIKFIGARPIYASGTDGDFFYFHTWTGDTAFFWSSNGTENGTAPLDTFKYIESLSSYPQLGNAVFFHAHDFDGSYGLYKVKKGVITFIKDLNPDDVTLTNYPYQTFTANNLLFFEVIGDGMYATDGTVAGTFKVSTVNPELSTAFNILDLNGGIFFLSRINNVDVIKFAETAQSTPITLLALNDSTRLAGYQVIGSTGYFLLDRRNENNTFNFFEIWKTNGTLAGTSKVYTFNGNSVSPFAFTKVDDQLVIFSSGCFSYDSGDDIYFCNAFDNVTMWKSDGTAQGTELIHEFNGVLDFIENFQTINTPFGTRLYFLKDGQLWESTLEVGGTRDLGVLYPQISKGIGNMVTFQGDLYLSALLQFGGQSMTLYKLIPEEFIITQLPDEKTFITSAINPMPVVDNAELILPGNYEGPIEVSITDIHGKNIMNIQTITKNNYANLDLQNLTNPGMYLYSCKAGTSVFNGKIFKK